MIVAQSEVTNRERLVWTGLLLSFFAFGLFDHALWSSNDTREGAMIWDMFRSGGWATPTLNGIPYLEKPPLLHWLSLVFCYLFGTINEGLVRLPAALFGAGAALLCWRWGKLAGRERAGFAAAGMCSTSLLYLEYSKIVLTDMAVVFTVMLALDFFWTAYQRRTKISYSIFLLTAALSFYAKGLIGPGMIWVAVGVFLLLRKEWKLLTWLASLFIPIFALILAPWVWALWKTGGSEMLYTVFWANQFGRFLTFSDQNLPPDPYFFHKEPFYYYLKQLPVRLLPWLGLVLPALYWWLRGGRRSLSAIGGLISAALLGIFLVLHASSAKVCNYALPAFPPLFLITAFWLEDVSQNWADQVVSKVHRFLIILTISLVALLTIVLAVTPLGYVAASYLNIPQATPLRVSDQIFSVATALLALSYIVVAWRYLLGLWRQKQQVASLLSLPAATMVAIILGGIANIPWYDFQRSYRPVAQMIQEQSADQLELALAVPNNENVTGAFNFYLNQRLPILPPNPVEISNYLNSAGQRRAIIIATKNLKDLLPALTVPPRRILTPKAAGYKSLSFCLITN